MARTWEGVYLAVPSGSTHYKYIDLPLSNYASSNYDRLMVGDKIAGFSMFTGCSYNERSMLSLGDRSTPTSRSATR